MTSFGSYEVITESTSKNILLTRSVLSNIENTIVETCNPIETRNTRDISAFH